MSCEKGHRETEPAQRGAGISPVQVRAVAASGGEKTLMRCGSCKRFISPRTMVCDWEGCDARGEVQAAPNQGEGKGASTPANGNGGVTARDVASHIPRPARQELYDGAIVCGECGRAYAKGYTACPVCHGTGQFDRYRVPGAARWMVEGRDTLSVHDLAQAFSEEGQGGRLSVLNLFPGVALRLDEAGKDAVWEEMRRSPASALLGHLPDAVVSAGGVEHLVEAARQNPAAARASLRALDVIREHHPDGERIADEVAGRGEALGARRGIPLIQTEVSPPEPRPVQTTVTQAMRDAFKAGSSPVVRGRARSTLAREMNYRGRGPIQGVMSRYEFVERAHQEGWQARKSDRGWVIGDGDSGFGATKTEADYLNHLANTRPSPDDLVSLAEPGRFDVEAEQDALMVSTGPQSYRPKEGVTRGQVRQFLARRSALESAERVQYRNGPVVAHAIDQFVKRGFTRAEVRRDGTARLVNRDGSQEVVLKETVEIDYLKLLMGRL